MKLVVIDQHFKDNFKEGKEIFIGLETLQF